MSLPKLACLCPTYNRPHLLPHALQSFLSQDYPADKCELIILDDAGQYETQSHLEPKPWTLISFNRRFRTMGEKRNATAALCSRDVDACVLWDDDDIYLPWTLKAHATALEHAPWSKPSKIFIDKGERLQLKLIDTLFHACWAFSRDAFAKVKGYPFIQSGQDKGLLASLLDAGTGYCDPLALGHLPFFVYRWKTVETKHLSTHPGDTGYFGLDKFVDRQQYKITKIWPSWPCDYAEMAMRALDETVCRT